MADSEGVDVWKPTADERYWAKVDLLGPVPEHRPELGHCWAWTAAKNNAGYGVLGMGHRKIVLAHRWAYAAFVGPIPEGADLDHLCRNRGCVRPRHLEPVTRSENLRRGDMDRNSKKTHCPQGHEYTAENTYRLGARRHCRTCRRLRARARN